MYLVFQLLHADVLHDAQGFPARLRRRFSAPYPAGQQHILVGGKFGQQVMELEDETDVGVAETGQFIDILRGDDLAVKIDFSRGLRVQQAQAIEQRAFAEPDGPIRAVKLPRTISILISKRTGVSTLPK